MIFVELAMRVSMLKRSRILMHNRKQKHQSLVHNSEFQLALVKSPWKLR